MSVFVAVGWSCATGPEWKHRRSLRWKAVKWPFVQSWINAARMACVTFEYSGSTPHAAIVLPLKAGFTANRTATIEAAGPKKVWKGWRRIKKRGKKGEEEKGGGKGGTIRGKCAFLFSVWSQMGHRMDAQCDHYHIVTFESFTHLCVAIYQHLTILTYLQVFISPPYILFKLDVTISLFCVAVFVSILSPVYICMWIYKWSFIYLDLF